MGARRGRLSLHDFKYLAMNPPILAPALAGNVLPSVGNGFVIAEWKDAGGPPGEPRWIAPLHLHRSDDEAWYVLEGTLIVRVGTDEIEVRAGAAVLVPHGTPHTYRNAGTGPVRYLLVMTPNVYGLIQDIHAMKERTPGALRAVFEQHD